MNFNKIYKKNISLLLLISILSINFSFFLFTPKANAILGVGDISTTNIMSVTDPVTLGFFTSMQAGVSVIAASSGVTAGAATANGIWQTIGKYTLESALAALAKQAALELVKQITQATVDWINTGFDGSSPAYVSNMGQFLVGPGGVADRAVGNFFANEPGLRFLCEPFKVQVALALQLHYGATLVDRLGCTYSAIAQNVQGAIDNSGLSVDVNGNVINVNRSNFKEKGGWNAWLVQTLRPENNPIGAYYTARGAMEEEIQNRKNTVAAELSFGQGALSYKRCVDIYREGVNGKELGRSSEYFGSGIAPKNIVPSSLGPNATVEQQCQMKTPGSTITGMLRAKANSAQQMTEVQAALANGIDSIIGALLTQLINAAKEKIIKGILDDDKNSPASVMYDKMLNLSVTQILGNYNNPTTSGVYTLSTSTSWVYVPSMWDYDPGTGLPFSTSTWAFDPATGLPSVFDPSVWYTPSTWKYDPITGLPTTWKYDPITGTQTYSDTTGNIGGSDPLSQAKNNSTFLINSLLKSEANYQNNYKIVQNILTQAKAVFATSSACNINYNSSSYILRSLLIRANVITNIDGTPNSDRTIASIPWNFEVIKAALADSNANITLLNKASTDVNNAGSITAITDAMIPVNSTSFNTDPQVKMVGNVKTWLSGVGSIYNSIFCPIDLTKVLQITTATSTTN